MHVFRIDFREDNYIEINYGKCIVRTSAYLKSMWKSGTTADRQLALAWLSNELNQEFKLAVLDEAGPCLLDVELPLGDIIYQNSDREFVITEVQGRFDDNSYMYSIQEICKSWK